MDWKIMLATFSTIFIAELGDKTQIATMIVAAKSRSPFSVILGSLCAFLLSTLIAVSLGHVLGEFLPERLIKTISGIAFLILGILIITGKI